MRQISPEDFPTRLSTLRLIASDMDGTLTQNEKFTAKLLDTLEKLTQASIPVLIITGRSAGWVEGLGHYLPIVGAIAENGGVFYGQNATSWELLTPIGDISQHRQALGQTFDLLRTFYPHLQESSDNRYRLTDWTFSVDNLNQSEIEHLKALTEQNGWSFTYSTVQCHIKPIHQDKAIGLKQVLQTHFPDIPLEGVLTVGDSPNDEPLFNPLIFPLSVGVANLGKYLDKLTHKPSYMTQKTEIDGFCEITELLT